jgi:DNA repair/transcription protein MET18/MMS19
MVDEVLDSPDGNAFQIVSIEGLVLLMRSQNLLSDFEKGTIIEKINALLLQPNRDESLNETAVIALRTISMTDPERFSSITMPNLAFNLPESLSKDQYLREQELNGVINKLEYLIQITCTVAWDTENSKIDPNNLVFTVYQKWLVSKAVKLFKQQDQLEYANVLLVAIYKGLEEFEAAVEMAKVTFGSLFDASTHPYFWIVQNLLKDIVRVKDVNGNPYVGLDFAVDKSQQVNDKFIRLVGDIITLVLRSKETTDKNNPIDNSSAVPSQVWALFSTDAPPSLDLSQQNLIKGPSDKCLANIISMSIVAGQQKGVSFRLLLDHFHISETIYLGVL